MRYIRYAILATLVIILLTVALANRGPVTIQVLPEDIAGLAQWNYVITIPLFGVVFGAVGFGILLGFVLEWIREARFRSEVSKRKRQVKELKREVNSLKVEKNEGKDEVLALLDDAQSRRAS